MGKWATYRNRGGSGGPGVIESFISRLTTAGGTIDATGTAAVTDLYNTLARTGVWDRLSEVWPCVGTNLTAAMQKLKIAPTTQTAYTNTGFVGGDYAQTGASGGLTGDGTAKFIGPGPALSSFGIDCSLFVAAKTANAGAGQRTWLGANNGTDYARIGSSNVATNVISRLGQAFNATYAQPSSAGYWTATRADANNELLYLGTLAVANNATVQTAMLSGEPTVIFAENGSGAATAFSPSRLTGAAFGRSLSASQVADLVAAWTAFDAALSR